jgi:hypothetical protein
VSVDDLNLQDAEKDVVVGMYRENSKDIREMLEKLSGDLPHYHNLDWRLDVQVLTCCLAPHSCHNFRSEAGVFANKPSRRFCWSWRPATTTAATAGKLPCFKVISPHSSTSKINWSPAHPHAHPLLPQELAINESKTSHTGRIIRYVK